MIRELRILAATLAVTLATGTGPAAAETYRWTDDKGGLHYGDGLDKVPAPYRSQATVVDGEEQPVNFMPAEKLKDQKLPAMKREGRKGKKKADGASRSGTRKKGAAHGKKSGD
jgi:hypothetical protein